MADSKSIDPTTEVIGLMEDLNGYIKKFRSVPIDVQQFKTNLSRKITDFSVKAQNLLFSQHVQLQDKLQMVFKTSLLIQEALNFFPQDLKTSDQYLDLTIIHNFLILNISSLGQYHDIWRLQSQANLLSTMLTRMPALEWLPDLPDPVDTGYAKQATRVRNALSTLFGIYLEAVLSIYSFSFSNFVEWTNKGFKYLKMYWDLISDVDLSNIIDLSVDNPEKVYLTYRGFYITLSNGFDLLQHINKIFGGIDVAEIETANVVPGVDKKSLEIYTEKMKSTFQSAIRKLNELYDKGDLSTEDPVDSVHVQRLMLVSTFSQLKIEHYRVISKIVPYMQEDRLLELESLIVKSHSFLDKLNQMNPNPDNPFSSELTFFYTDLFELIIPQFALHSFLSNSTDYFKIIQEYFPKIKQAGIETASIAFLFLKTEVSFVFRGMSTGSTLDLIVELSELQQYFQFKYRELLETYILQIILMYQGKFPQTVIDARIDRMEKLLYELSIDDNVFLEVQTAIKCLREIQNNHEMPHDHISIYDPHSWIMPDAIKLNDTIIPYFPISSLVFQIQDIPNFH